MLLCSLHLLLKLIIFVFTNNFFFCFFLLITPVFFPALCFSTFSPYCPTSFFFYFYLTMSLFPALLQISTLIKGTERQRQHEHVMDSDKDTSTRCGVITWGHNIELLLSPLSPVNTHNIHGSFMVYLCHTIYSIVEVYVRKQIISQSSWILQSLFYRYKGKFLPTGLNMPCP